MGNAKYAATRMTVSVGAAAGDDGHGCAGADGVGVGLGSDESPPTKPP